LTNRLTLEASTARSEALATLKEVFEVRGIEDPAREARLSLCAASGVSQVALITAPRQPLGSAASRVQEVAARRAAGEPLSRIVGRREFWGLSLAISSQVLDPRPETETIVEAALSILSDRRDEPLRILDLGVGSGALLCSLLIEFLNASGVGVDLSADAANLTLSNLEACGLAGRAEIRAGDWATALDGPFDLIVSNPPYIPTCDLPRLPREVRDFDPWVALDGGFDGLAAHRRIMSESRFLLAPRGRLLVEFGAQQAADLTTIAKQCGFTYTMTYKDLAGMDRVMGAALEPFGSKPTTTCFKASLQPVRCRGPGNLKADGNIFPSLRQ
jgi:release factor glutamine methyltransferase